MKNLMYLFVILALFALSGCNTKQTTVESSVLTGIWQNKNDSSISINFAKNGDYDLRIHGQRISEMPSGDPFTQKFLFDSLSNGINLMIYDTKSEDTIKCKLVFVEAGRIKISMILQDTVISEAEYLKVKM